MERRTNFQRFVTLVLFFSVNVYVSRTELKGTSLQEIRGEQGRLEHLQRDLTLDVSQRRRHLRERAHNSFRSNKTSSFGREGGNGTIPQPANETTQRGGHERNSNRSNSTSATINIPKQSDENNDSGSDFNSDSPRKAILKDARSADDSVSACVMVMDGNHELIEWLAYHYHTLPLRRLVLLTDPNSKTTPEPIIRRWEGLIDISLWNETHVPRGKPGKKQLNDVRRNQQTKFIETCMRSLRDEGQRWIAVMDPDEYIMVNDRVYDKKDSMYNLGLDENMVKKAHFFAPSMRESGAVLKFIKAGIAHVQRYGTQGNEFLETFQTPCLVFHRKNYGTFESEQDKNLTETPSLRTLRWRHWGLPAGKVVIGKSLVDMQRIYKSDKISGNVHRPLVDTGLCRWKYLWAKEKMMPLVMNHYPASLEQILFRSGDSRGGTQGRVERFHKEKTYKSHHDAAGNILEWLPGFIEAVGKEESSRLLEHAGKPYHANIGAYVDPSQEKTKEEYSKGLIQEMMKTLESHESSEA